MRSGFGLGLGKLAHAKTVEEKLDLGRALKSECLRMLSEEKLRQITAAVRSTPGFHNATIVHVVNGRGRAIHSPPNVTFSFEIRYYVVIEEVSIPDQAALEELRRWAVGNGESPPGAPNPIVVTNRSQLGPELIGVGLSCGLTIVSALGVFGGVAAEIPSGGTSTFLVWASWSGLVSGGAQCVNGLVRLREIVTFPDDNSLERWDDNDVYNWTFLAVDFIGVASGVAAMPAAGRNLFAILSRQRSFAARGLSLQRLQAMNRAQRLQAIKELVEEASRTREGRAALLKAARDAGMTRDFQAMSGLSVERSVSMVRAVSVETSRRLSSTLRDILNTAAGTVASGMAAEKVGVASGSVNVAINSVHSGSAYVTNVFAVEG